MKDSRLLSALLVAMILDFFGSPVLADRYQACSTPGADPGAGCEAEEEGAACNWLDDDTGLVHDGEVVYREAITLPNGVTIPAGYYCHIKSEIAGGELCSGGETLWLGRGAVGCIFSGTAVREQQCRGLEVIRPSRFLGHCTVCVEKGFVSLVLDKKSWTELSAGVTADGANAADFSCLGMEISKPPGGGQVHQPTLYVQWTRWLNRDGPGGTGDFETLRDHHRELPREVCETPVDVQCRVRGSGELVKTGVLANGEKFTCDRTVGAVCDNRKQPPGVRCRDYEVRFACQEGLRHQRGRTVQ